ncbi:MAG: electron transfer flavoprotein subunit alpha/FixB family protein [Anaerolineales bacterium]
MVQSLYSLDEEQAAIWVYLEHDQGVLQGVSLELLSKARELADPVGWSVTGLLLTHEAGAEMAQNAFHHGADEVWLWQHPLLEHFSIDSCGKLVGEAMLEGRPSVFLAGATHDGRDLAGRLAVRLRAGLTADCTQLALDRQTGTLVGEVSGFGGGVLAMIEAPEHRPQMATVRPGVFTASQPDRGRQGELLQRQVELAEDEIRDRVIEHQVGEAVDLTQAPVLVVGGRGVEGDFGPLRQLARHLGGEVGATRPPIDDGFIQRERQIGQTGVVCRPKVAIVVGASGAFQFVVGVQEADLLIAINNDPEASIFDYADYGIVGDAAEVVPAILKHLEAAREVVHG